MGSDPDHILAPDVSFVSEARAGQETIRHGAVEQPPDLAVEVTSPNDTDARVQEKVDDYLAAEVQRVWVVRPALRSVTVHRPNGDAHTFREGSALTSDDAGFAMAGFELELRRLFETYSDA
jgi:Uma2 family endonuclease